jgi:adenine-specific DNA-methyltransferase
MKAGSQGSRIDAPNSTFAIADTYAVLFNIDAASEFVGAVEASNDRRVAYIVTDDEKQFQIVAARLPQSVETVRLYEAYLRTFQLTGGVD